MEFKDFKNIMAHEAQATRQFGAVRLVQHSGGGISEENGNTLINAGPVMGLWMGVMALNLVFVCALIFA